MSSRRLRQFLESAYRRCNHSKLLDEAVQNSRFADAGISQNPDAEGSFECVILKLILNTIGKKV